jgi:hypothetical protein
MRRDFFSFQGSDLHLHKNRASCKTHYCRLCLMPRVAQLSFLTVTSLGVRQLAAAFRWLVKQRREQGASEFAQRTFPFKTRNVMYCCFFRQTV